MLQYILRHKGAVISVMLFVTSLLLVLTPGEEGTIQRKSRSYFLTLISPVQKLINSVCEDVVSIWNNYIYLVNLKEENQKLESDYNKISSKYQNLITLYNEAEKKNRRLEEILGFTESSLYRLEPARVIGRDPLVYSSTIVVDKGADDEVITGMPVISSSGIVGVVIAVSKSSSRIMLINDKNSRIDVLFQDNRARGILEGSGDGSIRIAYVDRKEDIKAGDIVVTSGMGGIFDKGLLVGEVLEVNKASYGMFQEIIVTPKTDLDRIEEVLIVIE